MISFVYFYPGKQAANFLLLGISGPGHEGPLLTDSMIFSSVNQSGTSMISLPRDIWYAPLQSKINALYYYGQQKGDDLVMLKDTVQEMLGENVDYWVILDFTAFKKAVDLVGGIDLQVENTLDDYRYPIAGKENDLCDGDKEFKCRYEHLYFERGWVHLDGETALKFVRSRYAEGDEGTDFARSKRQEKVIAALKNKILSLDFLLSPKKIQEGWNIFQEGVKTNLSVNEILPLTKLFFTSAGKGISNFILGSLGGTDTLFYHPKTHSSGQWVILPVDQSWKQVQEFVDCFINQPNKQTCPFAGKQPAQF